MLRFKLFSKRKKEERGEVPDVLQYDELLNPFRVQVIHIIRDAIGKPSYGSREDPYEILHDYFCREYGVFTLSENGYNDEEKVFTFLLNADTEHALDVIEFVFRFINYIGDDYSYRRSHDAKISGNEAISELNHRFLEHGIGYQFEADEIVRIDSQITHKEIVKPMLQALKDPDYEGANEEFLSAFDHYRHGRYKECLNDCLKALESTMKAICKKRKWAFNQNDTAQKLIQICFENNLIPSFLQSHFSSLRSSLESGVPTIRNRLSGHGQGTEKIEVPEYLVGYMVHLTASAIQMLVQAEKVL